MWYSIHKYRTFLISHSCNKNNFRIYIFRYSGCHYYDASALNIVLGLRYKFISNEYSFRRPVKLFTEVPLRKADAILRELEQNATTDGHLQVVS